MNDLALQLPLTYISEMSYKRITTPITVRFRDIDAMGHVNNSVFMTYFEEGRKVFLRDIFYINEPSQYPFILAKISCDYVRPINLDDGVALDIWVSTISGKSFKFIYKLFDPRDTAAIYAMGESVMVFYDYAGKKTIPLSDEFKKRIAEYCE